MQLRDKCIENQANFIGTGTGAMVEVEIDTLFRQ